MILYITNVRVTINKPDDVSHRGYIMGYTATTRVILYYKPYQPFVIHISHHVWFDKNNSRLSIEENHNPGSLLLQQYP